MLGTSPETDQAEIRLVLGKYGEIIDAQKGFISKKLPGCTNGIWTVKMFLGDGKSLPPFLIMKDDGEVWQLATGEASVCWKCGKSGHIGDKCRQDVNVLAESLASPAVGVQHSWAHVVRGGVSVVVAPPAPPPRPQAQQLFSFKLSGGVLKAGKASLKPVQKPTVKNVEQLGKVVSAPVLKISTVVAVEEPFDEVEAASMDVQLSSEHENIVGRAQKKAKLSREKEVQRDPRLRAKETPVSLSSSPELHHKVSAGGREQLHGLHSEGEQQLGQLSEGQI